MNLEDKKFLAEWMGYLLEGKNYWMPKFNIYLMDWPNHEQFKEVWNKLNVEEQDLVFGQTTDNKLAFIHMLLNELHKVVQAVIEVIKEAA